MFAESGTNVNVSDIGLVISNLAEYGRPFLREIVDHADLIIVHSPIAAQVINTVYGVNTEYFPVAMPYPFQQSQLTDEARLHAKIAAKVALNKPCIVSFGEVHLMKGAKQCLFAMKELKDWGIDFQFLFVGPVAPSLEAELYSKIDEYGLREYVTITGGVPEAEYIRYLQAGDIVLQIRQIPYGQVSGALLDAVSAGMSGVASENLARSIEAPAMIRRVNDKASPTIFAEQIAKLIESEEYLDRPGEGWKAFTDKHDFAVYAKKLLSLLFGPAKLN
jgi:glycosyltransferase involved in cell wall biosynthesis